MLTLCHICCKYFHPIDFLLDLLWCFLFGPQNFFFGNGICHFFSCIISGFLFVVRPFLFQDCNIFLMSLLIFSFSASLYSSTSLLLLPGRDCSFSPSFCKWGSCTSVISQGHAPSFYGSAENRTQCSLHLNLSPLPFPVWVGEHWNRMSSVSTWVPVTTTRVLGTGNAIMNRMGPAPGILEFIVQWIDDKK